MVYIRLLLVAYLLGLSSSATTKHRRQRQQPAYIIPPSFGSFAPNIEVQEGNPSPNKEPTVVFTRITIPKNREQYQPQQYEDPNNFLIQSQYQPQSQPQSIVEIDPLTPTTYRPPPSELIEEVQHANVDFDSVTPSQHQVVNVQQPQMITYYSDPPSHHSAGNLIQLQYVSTGLRQGQGQGHSQGQGHGQMLAPPPSHFIQHFTTTTVEHEAPIQIESHTAEIFPHQTYHQAYQSQPHGVNQHTENGGGGVGSLAGALSSAANLLKSTASKMTEYVPPFIRINQRPNYTPIRIPGIEVNSLINHHAPQFQQVSYKKAKTGKKRVPLTSTSQYYSYGKKYTAKQYAGSMPPPSTNPAPKFYSPAATPEPEISYPTYFVNSQLSPQHVVGIEPEQMQTSPSFYSQLSPQNFVNIDQEDMQTSPSFHRPVYMRHPTRVRVKIRRIPKKYYLVKNSSSPTWTILRSRANPIVQAYDMAY